MCIWGKMCTGHPVTNETNVNLMLSSQNLSEHNTQQISKFIQGINYLFVLVFTWLARLVTFVLHSDEYFFVGECEIVL